MIGQKWFFARILFSILFFSFHMMAQSNIVINDGIENPILIASEQERSAALLLKSYLDKSFSTAFYIETGINYTEKKSKIHLEIRNSKKLKEKNSFLIKSDENSIFLIASNEKTLRYAIYTLLETWGFRKFTSKETYIPKLHQFEFPKNTEQIHLPTFEYRMLLYPDAYDPDFRDWHKLDWYLDDFTVWGHSFDKLLPPKEYFKTNPIFFALYDGSRRAESLCMTNDTVVELVEKKIQLLLSKKPNIPFFSVSQNDDAVFCECKECQSLNKKHGGPQGSLYFFLNKIAKHFPKLKIVTLAYLHTLKPPVGIKIESNIYTLFCPIELNRGKTVAVDDYSKSFRKTTLDWEKTASHLYLWDYTVQFSNYLSPFPNLHTLSDNYKFYKKNKVKGLFVQGYADVPGDFTELRQYLLAKLLWNPDIDIEKTTDDFLRGFYGKAAPIIRKYLNLLSENQEKSNAYLDIYSGPVQSRNTFLTPEAMSQYDQLLNEASLIVYDDATLETRINKLRLSLEFVFFEQSKFYGKDKHGMFTTNEKGIKELKSGLSERVLKFTKSCTQLGIYELQEGGIAPEKYYEEWLAIAKNTTNHLGEKLDIKFLTPPAKDFTGKGSYGLADGNRGFKDYNINWIGWYGTNPEIEISTKKLIFNTLKINFLNDQRHWIFKPTKVSVYGFVNNEWLLVTEKSLESLEEDAVINIDVITLNNKNFSKFEKIKLLITNQVKVPMWRERKSKKPMVMIDEIELYTN